MDEDEIELVEKTTQEAEITPESIPRRLLLDIERSRTLDEIIYDAGEKSSSSHGMIERTSSAMPPGYVLLITVAEEVELYAFPEQVTTKVTSFRANSWHSEPGNYYFIYGDLGADTFRESVELGYEEILDIQIVQDSRVTSAQ